MRYPVRKRSVRIFAFILAATLFMFLLPIHTFAALSGVDPQEESEHPAFMEPVPDPPESPSGDLPQAPPEQTPPAAPDDEPLEPPLMLFGGTALMSACTAPDYCEDGECTCSSDSASCACEAACACRIHTQSPCVTPDDCANGACLCKGQGAETCICDTSCQCRYPSFNASSTATVTNANPKTGESTSVQVGINLSSSAATFKDIVLKTYVKDTITLHPPDLDGRFTHLKTEHEGDYNVIYISIPDTNAAAGVYDLTMQFPGGVTLDGTAADVYTVITGTVVFEQGELPFGEEQNDEVIKAGITAQAQETTWNVALKNVALDYKDEAQNHNIFRQQVTLTRSPTDDTGVYYLDQNETSVTIALPGDAGDASLLRLTAADGTPIGYTVGENNTIIIPAGNIPFGSGFSDGYSESKSGTFYMVFELSETCMNDKAITEDGFTIGYDIETHVDFDYQTIKGVYHDDDTATVDVIDYVPAGGDGSLGKWAEPFIEGKTFYDNTNQKTPIEYHIGFTNDTNTPLNNLVITDERPGLRTIVGSVSVPIPEADVPAASVYFYQVTLTRNTTGNDVYLVQYVNGVPQGSRQLLSVSTPIEINSTAIDKIEIIVDGIVEHGKGISGTVDVLGDAALAGAEPEQVQMREKVKFVRNTATFTAASTKENNPALSGSGDAQVHVYPFDNELDPPKIWDLNGKISQTNSGYDTSATITRGNDVYYRIDVSPKDAEQFVYSPVFFMELPPEVIFNETTPDITISGAASGLGYTASVISNPLGTGKLLMIVSNGRQLLSPGGHTYITVKGRINPDTPQGVVVDSKVYFGVMDDKTPLDFTDGFVTAGKLLSASSQAQALSAACSVSGIGFLESTVSLKVRGSGYLEGELSVQTEFDRGTNTWHRHPEIAVALPGGQLTYKFNVRNGGQVGATDIVLYNVFSTMGDYFIIGNTQRGSEWKPYLTGPVQLPAGLESVATVYYSEYDNHRVSINGNYSGTDDWTTHPYNWPAVKAIKIVFDSTYTLAAEAQIEITVPMFAPTDYTFQEAGNNHAISSLATQFKFVGSTNDIALEPLRVIVDMVKPVKGEISGIVWGDVIKNGVQDALGTSEFVEAGREVMLFQENGGNYTYLFSTISDLEGAYKFTNLDDGTYKIRIVLPTGYGASVIGTDNSFTVTGEDTYPASHEESGLYDYVETAAAVVIAVAAEETKIHEEVDGAIYPEPTTISGTVWRSMDYEGTNVYARGDATRDKGLEGVSVTLHRIISGTERTQIGSAITTDSDGEYTFEDVPAGRYVVVFQELSNYTFISRTEASFTKGAPTLPNQSQVATKAGNGDIKGQSFEIWLKPSTPQEGVDCGMRPAKGSISGNIWRDTNGNMARDLPGETGISGVTLTLTKTATDGIDDVPPGTTATTDASGNYSFGGLTPGTYSVSYTGTVDYVSNYEGTTVLEGSRILTHTFADIVIKPEDGTKKDISGKNLGLAAKLTISGSVFNDTNASGTFDGTDAKLIAAVTAITITRTEGGDGSTDFTQTMGTDASGDYTLTVWPGTYTVAFSSATGAYQLNSNSKDADNTEYASYLTVKANVTTGYTQFVRNTRTYTLVGLTADKDKVDLALTRPRTISGMVWLDKDGNGTYAAPPDEFFNPGRQLTIAAKGSGAVTPAVPQKSSDTADGTYLFERLYPGEYTITVDTTNTPDAYKITNYIGNAALSTAGVYTITIPKQDTGRANDPKDKNFGLALPVTITGVVWQDKEMIQANNYVFNGSYDGSSDGYYGQANIAALYRLDGAVYKPWSGTAYVAEAAALKAASTSIAGEYVFAPQIPGTYKVVLTPATSYFVSGPSVALVQNPTGANGNATFTKTDTVGTWEGIKLYSGEKLTADAALGINLSIGKYITISGVVYHDLNGNGVKDGGLEGPFEDADTYVQLQRKDEDSVYQSVGGQLKTTGGSYSFKVKPGEYQIVFKQGAWRVTNGGGKLVVVEGDVLADRSATWEEVDYTDATTENIVNKDYLISVYSGISGYAWVDKNADAVFDVGEAVKTDASLVLTYESGSYTTWFADTYPAANKTQAVAEDGSYAFPDLWPGTYKITLTGAGDYLRTNISGNGKVTAVNGTDKEWIVVVDSYSTITNVNFGLIKPSSIAGEVWHDANNNGVNDTAEQTMGTITAVRTATGNMVPYTNTVSVSSTGFSLTGLLPGTYTLTVGLDTGAWLRTYIANTVSLGSNPADAATITPDGTNIREFTLTITDPTGNGVAVANVKAGYAKQSTVTGLVFNDIDNDDVQESGENALAGIKATLTRMKDGAIDTDFTPLELVTGSPNNDFTFQGLLPGGYELTLTEIAAAYLVTTPDGKDVGLAPGAAAEFGKENRKWTITIPTDDSMIGLKTGVVTARTIAGKVWQDIDADAVYDTGEPYFSPGVTVKLYQDYTGSNTLIGTAQLTDTSTGAYSFSGLYPGGYTVEITKPDSAYYPSDSNCSPVPSTALVLREVMLTTADQSNVNFPLSRKISIAGRVWEDKDAGGANGVYNADSVPPDAPKSGAWVALMQGVTEVARKQTLADGTYAFTDLVPGTYTVKLVDTAYSGYALTNSINPLDPVYTTDTYGGSVALDATEKAWTVERYDGFEQVKIDFALSSKSVISVKVWTDTDGSGAMDGEESVRAGTQVRILKSTNGGVSYTQVALAWMGTDAAGYVKLTDLGLGYYRIEVEPETNCGVTNTTGNVTYQLLEITKYGVNYEKEFGIAQYVTFSGQVWTELDGDGVYQPGGTGETVAAHPVEIKRGTTTLALSTTLANGSFAVTAADKVLPGSFTVTVGEKAGHVVTNRPLEPAGTSRLWSFALTSGGDKKNVDCGFTPLRTIEGFVWLDADTDKDYGSGESYFTGAVTLQKKVSGSYTAVTGSTDIAVGFAGEYVFSGLLPGEYRVVANTAAGAYVRTNPPAGLNEDEKATCMFAGYAFGAGDTSTTKSDKIGLVAPVRISGHAYLDKNSNGTFDGLDTPKVVEVTLRKMDGTDVETTYPVFSTKADGTYDTGHLSLLPGSYQVEFAAVTNPGHRATNTHAEFTPTTRIWKFTLLPGADRGQVDIGYGRSDYIIKGLVFEDLDGDGGKADAEPVFTLSDDIKLTATHPTFGSFTGTVQDDGTYSISVDGPGDYTITATLPNGYVVTLRTPAYNREADEFYASVTYEEPEAILDFGAAMGYTVAGQIWADLNADAVKDTGEDMTLPTGGKIQLIAIAADGTLAGYVEAEVALGADGTYSFTGLKPGRYMVNLADLPGEKAFYTGYAGSDAPDAAVSSFDARRGQWILTVADADISAANSGYHEPSEISGVLINQNTKQPVPNQKVVLFKKDDTGAYVQWDETNTDDAGGYLFQSLTVGEYRVEITILDGYTKDSASPGVQDGVTVAIDIPITAMGETVDDEVQILQAGGNGGGPGGGPGLSGGPHNPVFPNYPFIPPNAYQDTLQDPPAGSGNAYGGAVATGDDSDLTLWIVLALLSACGMALTFLHGRKKNKKHVTKR